MKKTIRGRVSYWESKDQDEFGYVIFTDNDTHDIDGNIVADFDGQQVELTISTVEDDGKTVDTD